MNILVIGNGAREHAIAWKLRQSCLTEKLYVAPGNAGTNDIAENLPIQPSEFAKLAETVRKRNINLTVVGPETPLSEGIVDYFSERGLKIFGPDSKSSRIESSKVFAKKLMRDHGIPTGNFEVFDSFDEACKYSNSQPLPVVIKADGLASGKGVIIAYTHEQAINALKLFMVDRAFGKAGESVLIEEFLIGKEVSVFTFTDGNEISQSIAACDYKKVYDNDEGPNTGGMGSYSPPSFWTSDLATKIRDNIIVPTISALRKEGSIYKGVLYSGIILTKTGPKVLEFNCRLGDPETQVILPLLLSDLTEVFSSIAEGNLSKTNIKWSEDSSLGVVMASSGYPSTYPMGLPISGLDSIDLNGLVFHGGTDTIDDPNPRIVTNGGRVLTVVGTGKQLKEAKSIAYENVARIHFQGGFYRKDIGLDT